MKHLGALLLLAGCATSRLGAFSILTSETLLVKLDSMGAVQGRDCVQDANVLLDWIFSPFEQASDPSIQRAAANALAQAPGADALVNLTVDRRVTWIGFAFDTDCVTVTGYATHLADRLQ